MIQHESRKSVLIRHHLQGNKVVDVFESLRTASPQLWPLLLLPRVVLTAPEPDLHTPYGGGSWLSKVQEVLVSGQGFICAVTPLVCVWRQKGVDMRSNERYFSNLCLINNESCILSWT